MSTPTIQVSTDASQPPEGQTRIGFETFPDAVDTAPTLLLPSLTSIVMRTGRRLTEASVAPTALFYVLLWRLGFGAAIAGALLLAYGSILRRLIRRDPVPCVLILSAGLLTERTVASHLTHSAFVYFVQPVCGTLMVSLWFLSSALRGTPLAQRLVADFCPLPASVKQYGFVRRAFRQISVLFGVIYVINATGTIFLLTHVSIGSFVLLKSVVFPTLTGAGAAVGFLVFRRGARRHGVSLRWAESSPRPMGRKIAKGPANGWVAGCAH